jgi:hypothetical protein
MVIFATETTGQIIGITVLGSVFLICLFTFMYAMARLDRR